LTLIEWLKTLSEKDQDKFFRLSARFFSNKELSDIIKYITSGYSLFHAHLKAGVLYRYTVDLENLRREM
jgi:hypothetical protein